jgi:hypothetical protein
MAILGHRRAPRARGAPAPIGRVLRAAVDGNQTCGGIPARVMRLKPSLGTDVRRGVGRARMDRAFAGSFCRQLTISA